MVIAAATATGMISVLAVTNVDIATSTICLLAFFSIRQEGLSRPQFVSLTYFDSGVKLRIQHQKICFVVVNENVTASETKHGENILVFLS